MEKRIFIIMQVDLIYYPPALTLIKTLCDLKYTPIYVGEYSDEKQKNELRQRGVQFIDTPRYDVRASLLKKWIAYIQYKHYIYKILETYKINDCEEVWLLNDGRELLLLMLDKIVKKYKTGVQLYEFSLFKYSWKHRLLNPFFNARNTLRQVNKVVCCEYNRAQIEKNVFQLSKTPYILPNKPYDEEEIVKIPDDIRDVLNNISEKVAHKHVLLYQGIIYKKDRRLDEFCEAISELPESYMFVIMGKTTPYAEQLRMKYPSERILFAPFIRPPYHLLVTQMASIGILSYIPDNSSMENVINTIYCAPNKIFEYAKYSKPMIANDVPGLKYIFSQYGCGEVVDYPLRVREIVNKIHQIEKHYDEFAGNARKYYDSIQLAPIIQQIVEE